MSILYFQPTAGYKDTAKNVYTYVKDHLDVFWDIFKPLIPYIAICIFLDALITEYYMGVNPKTGQKNPFFLFTIVAHYFNTCLIVSWHRVIIHGPDRYEPMKPFKPKKSELIFIGMGIAVLVGVLICSIIIGASTLFFAIISKSLGTSFGGLFPIIAGLFVFAFATWCFARASFYFPSKATGDTLSIGEAFKLTHGYAWRLIIVPLLSMWKVILASIIYLALGFVVLMVAIMITGGEDGLISAGLGAVIAGFIYNAPIHFFFTPIMTIITITVLSNYYQYAVQNTHTTPVAPKSEPDYAAELEKHEEEAYKREPETP